jgi:hypothetical protein
MDASPQRNGFVRRNAFSPAFFGADHDRQRGLGTKCPADAALSGELALAYRLLSSLVMRALASLLLVGSLVACSSTDPESGPSADVGNDALAGAADEATSAAPGCTTSSTGPDTALPLGQYTQCSASVSTPNDTSVGGGNGVVTLSQSNGVLTAAIGGDVDQYGPFAPITLTFDARTNATAVISGSAQVYDLSNWPFSPASQEAPQSVKAASGVLALDGNTLSISVFGPGSYDSSVLSTIQCPLPAQSSGFLQASAACDTGDIPARTYTQCSENLPSLNGGTVTIGQSGGTWTASIHNVTNVPLMAPALRLSAPRGQATTITPGQMAYTDAIGPGSCIDEGSPSTSGGGIATPGIVGRAMTITNGSVIVDGDILFVSFGGTDECGDPLQESLYCSAE